MTYTLLIQTHNKTGLKYLCKTTREKYFNYKGSGKYWKRHLKMYGRDVLTYVLYQTNDLESFRHKCSYYSTHYDVVNSKSWANLIPENGTDGGKTFDKPSWLIGFSHSDETKAIIGKAAKESFKARKSNGDYVSPLIGYKHSDEAKDNMRKPKSAEHRLAISKGRKKLYEDRKRINQSS
jgi:hypothetical protein